MFFQHSFIYRLDPSNHVSGKAVKFQIDACIDENDHVFYKPLARTDIINWDALGRDIIYIVRKEYKRQCIEAADELLNKIFSTEPGNQGVDQLH